LIIDRATLQDLNRMMNAVIQKDRIRIYDSFVDGFAASRPLPRLQDLGVQLPPCASSIVQQLYADLCALDYRKRLTDFKTIFSRLNRISIILKNEAAYQNWLSKRRLYRDNARLKRSRRDNHVVQAA